MKTKINLPSVATITAFLFLSIGCKFINCVTGIGPITTEERKTESFESIETMGSSNVHIKRGDVFNIQIKDHSNLLKHFKTEVKSATLKLGFDEEKCVNNSKMDITITMPYLKKLESLGSGDVEITGKFEGSTLTTEILGSGQILVKDSCVYKVFNASITGSGDTKAKEGKFENATVEILGSGSMVIGETDLLHIDISGSGNVSYYGNPSLKSEITGSGAINKISK